MCICATTRTQAFLELWALCNAAGALPCTHPLPCGAMQVWTVEQASTADAGKPPCCRAGERSEAWLGCTCPSLYPHACTETCTLHVVLRGCRRVYVSGPASPCIPSPRLEVTSQARVDGISTYPRLVCDPSRT